MDGNQWLVFGQCRNAAFQSLADNNALSLVYKSAHCCQLKSSRDERDEERGRKRERERERGDEERRREEVGEQAKTRGRESTQDLGR